MILEKPKTRKDILCKKIGSEVLLYDPKTEKVHVLNSTSYFIWELIDGNNSIEQMENSVRDYYQPENSQDVKVDVQRTIDKFIQMGLLE